MRHTSNPLANSSDDTCHVYVWNMLKSQIVCRASVSWPDDVDQDLNMPKQLVHSVGLDKTATMMRPKLTSEVLGVFKSVSVSANRCLAP